jgi:starch synthase (maltosyl-transferring)
MEANSTARVVIENVHPSVDCGRFPARRIAGDTVVVTADIFADGHDAVAARLLHRGPGDAEWTASPMEPAGNDAWTGRFRVEELGLHRFCVEGWVDRFASWRDGLEKKYAAGRDVAVDLLAGAEIVEREAERAGPEAAAQMMKLAGRLKDAARPDRAVSAALGDEAATLMRRYPGPEFATRPDRELEVRVDRPRARFSTWYERFPRSCSPDAERSGTFRDLEALLPEIARMGFDVIYLPPIHPIGRTSRKGRNNSPSASEGDPGSPWAVGSPEGGHKSIDPGLGTFEDLERLIESASRLGIETAVDIAFQCSPDHPYVREHPEWFKIRPDGSVQFAENPPKKYEDIFPLNFETDQWKSLWKELKSIVTFWLDKGIRIFRMDNPHTKPFPFWEWLLAEIKRECPEAIFLAEAFTRPKVMKRLAKAGFTQSYTYFTWRNSKPEITAYLEELTRTDVKEYFRPNFWPNTPDILPEFLQYGGREAFVIKLVLAATLSSNYGIYGPAFELVENRALPGREEYLDSEKYEIRHWNWNAQGNLKDFIARINAIRRHNPALQETNNLRFFDVDNEQMLFYGKMASDPSQTVLVVVNLDPASVQSGWLRIPMGELGIDPAQAYLGDDLLGGQKFIWHGEKIFIKLDPRVVPAHIFRLRTRFRRETDFDYFM